MDSGYSFIWPSGKIPYMIDGHGNLIDPKRKRGNNDKIKKPMEGLSDDCASSEGENMMVIDVESGDELEDITNTLGRPKMNSPKRPNRKKANKGVEKNTIAAGSEVDDDEEHMEREGDCDEFEDEFEYEPSIGPDVGHEIEVEDVPDEEKREDEDDVMDVGGEDGSVRLSKRGTLRNDARSKVHLLTHRYKNPYCESCVREKMKHRKTFRGAFQRKLNKFGDLVTFDYLDNRRIQAQDYGSDKTIFVISILLHE